MPAQRTGGGRAKWAVWDRLNNRPAGFELTLREAKQTAAAMNVKTGGHERYAPVKFKAEKVI